MFFDKNSISIFLCPSLLPNVAHQQLRNDSNRDGGEGNESQPQSKHFTSLNTCSGLLVPWEKTMEKTHRGCTLAHNCPVCLVHSPQTTIAKCLFGMKRRRWVYLRIWKSVYLTFQLSALKWLMAKCYIDNVAVVLIIHHYCVKISSHEHVNVWEGRTFVSDYGGHRYMLLLT